MADTMREVPAAGSTIRIGGVNPNNFDFTTTN